MALEYNTVCNRHQKNRGPQNRRTALLAAWQVRMRATRCGPQAGGGDTATARAAARV